MINQINILEAKHLIKIGLNTITLFKGSNFSFITLNVNNKKYDIIISNELAKDDYKIINLAKL